MIILRELIHPKMDDFVKIYCDDLLGSKVKNTLIISKATYFGQGEDLAQEDDFPLLPELLDRNTKMYQKMVKNGCLYDTKEN